MSKFVVVALVEVAEMVSMEAMSGVVVPIAKMSVAVWGMTRSPVSVQPEVLVLPETAPQVITPLASAFRALEPEQEVRDLLCIPPEAITMPPAKVEEAVVERVWRELIWSPEANVEVAVEVETR